MRKATKSSIATGLGLLALAFAILLPAANAEAQPDPGAFTINHFNIYQNFNETASGYYVALRDQFGEREHTLGRIEWYGVPVDKNFEGVPDPFAHLTWWRLTDNIEEPQRRVVVSNQFGDQTLDVLNSQYLLSPSSKNEDLRDLV